MVSPLGISPPSNFNDLVSPTRAYGSIDTITNFLDCPTHLQVKRDTARVRLTTDEATEENADAAVTPGYGEAAHPPFPDC
jgi:hypothetical protein